jgi:D-sedoheptulose 7-phosphate isomerase
MKEDHRSELARKRLEESIEVKKKTVEACVPDVIAAVDLVVKAFHKGAKLFICGNGGSAADSQHMAAELTSRLTTAYDRPGLPALALTTDSSFLTAYANDFGFEGIFERQIQALGSPGDVVLGISTSGNSRNVLLAVQYARANGMKAICLTGSGGELVKLADVCIQIPSRTTSCIQEAHLAVEHLICFLVERELYGYEEKGA